MLTGAVLGIAIGVMVGWSVAPTPNVDTTPLTLRSDFKDQYRYMIAAAYSADGNLGRAQARLALLGDASPVKALGDQSQRMLANNTSQEVVNALADLSQAIQGQSSAPTSTLSPQTITQTPAGQTNGTPDPPTTTPDLAEDTPTPGESATPAIGQTQENTPTPTVTATPASLLTVAATVPLLATPTATATMGAPFVLTKQSTFCDANQPGLVQIILLDPKGQQVAGVELIMTWAGGEEHFFTGLKPELGNGYADYVISAGVEYALTISGGGTRTKFTAPACSNTDGTSFPGGYHLEFKEP